MTTVMGNMAVGRQVWHWSRNRELTSLSASKARREVAENASGFCNTKTHLPWNTFTKKAISTPTATLPNSFQIVPLTGDQPMIRKGGWGGGQGAKEENVHKKSFCTFKIILLHAFIWLCILRLYAHMHLGAFLPLWVYEVQRTTGRRWLFPGKLNKEWRSPGLAASNLIIWAILPALFLILNWVKLYKPKLQKIFVSFSRIRP